ncbi:MULTISPECIES: GlxA family transcriptional regulator [Inquilinus]|uniref:Transcriptional regulator GlxA family with amidase domain n=1 Tax=Inquilinus ginsengisoli TaxID=363840 RepID=A0ABU1JXI0_9PROT|nr:helix-turn-helix domain-containing protein [Inquilinus ginsengisoli]MDR6292279.1 transcriptional regulator GlxA family with amidase domain [Inquilinus ginsengisoli]
MLAFPGVELLDVVGPLEVFAAATALQRDAGAPPGYAVEVLAARAGPVRATSGLSVLADRGLDEAGDGIDTLLVAGGAGIEAAVADAALVAWLRGMAPRVRRLGSVCTGALLLAEAGLLDGRRAATHWNWCERLSRRYPAVRVEPDPIFIQDGRVWTSAGVTAGMDLALALIEADHGRDLALATARDLVMFLKRPGGQSQFSAALAGQIAERPPLRALQDWMLAHPEADLSVPALADRAAMSPRNFARAFLREIGATPAAYVERLRIEAARRRLEETDLPGETVARSCGFGNADGMRRAFLRRIGVAPSDYRERFRPPAGNGRAAIHAPDLPVRT